MTVWDQLVGQHHVVEQLERAARDNNPTHAWLFTGLRVRGVPRPRERWPPLCCVTTERVAVNATRAAPLLRVRTLT